MRLTATISNPIGLHRIAMTLEKLGSACLICFTPESIRFIWYQQQKAGKRIWINVDPHTLFSQYRVKSQDNNEVSLSVDLESFIRATKAAQQTHETKIELGQRVEDGHRHVLLIWRMQMETRSGTLNDTRQELEVERLPSERIRHIWEPPVLDNPHAYIVFPGLQTIKPLVDRMKSLSKYMTIAANMNGQLKLSVDTDAVQVESAFSGLDNPRLEGYETPEENKHTFASVDILTEDLASFLNCHNLEPQNVICVITDQASLAFYVYVSLDSYMPVNEHHLFIQHPETILTCHIPVYLP
ncbi:checkpoint protein Hus1/Mec3 [Absidia repens]|uniref:Checkpoint protein n=1 Tax=Absidia repens TaxID=90262 RepID=A0A1X2ICQ9_9FUNG|nr:checkpoint protein Hus1/Mec3 [Absidia repens]